MSDVHRTIRHAMTRRLERGVRDELARRAVEHEIRLYPSPRFGGG